MVDCLGSEPVEGSYVKHANSDGSFNVLLFVDFYYSCNFFSNNFIMNTLAITNFPSDWIRIFLCCGWCIGVAVVVCLTVLIYEICYLYFFGSDYGERT